MPNSMEWLGNTLVKASGAAFSALLIGIVERVAERISGIEGPKISISSKIFSEGMDTIASGDNMSEEEYKAYLENKWKEWRAKHQESPSPRTSYYRGSTSYDNYSFDYGNRRSSVDDVLGEY